MNIDSARIKDEANFGGSKNDHLHSKNYQGYCSICAEKIKSNPMIFNSDGDVLIFNSDGDVQNPKTEKIYTKYRLESPDGEYSIFAKVSGGLITLETKRSDKEFIFLKSKKEDLRAIAELFLRACEL